MSSPRPHLWTPARPGALAASGDYLRADVARRELEFLIAAHGLDRIVLLFHGAAPEGPDGAICADYRRRLSGRPREELAARQEQDAAALIGRIGRSGRISVRAFRADVDAGQRVRFHELHSDVERSRTP